MKKPAPSRLGFTLVELLVVIAIIGVLVALLLPAVQQAREASRRVSCGNNIRQIAIALHTYNDTHQALPITYGDGNYSVSTQGKSWLVGILPFIEQQPLYDKINFTANFDPAVSTSNYAVSATKISSFLCPSDGSNGRGLLDGRANMPATTLFGVMNYKGCSGSNWDSANGGDFSNNTPTPPTGKWPGEKDGLNRGNGWNCRNGNNERPNYIGLNAITDGTSSTFALGEAVPAWSFCTQWWYFNSCSATCAIPLNYRRNRGAGFMAQNLGDWPNNYSFQSQHPAGANFAYMDAHVSFIANNVDLTTYRWISTISGGETASVQ